MQRFVDGDGAVHAVQTRLVREQLRNGDVALARCGELGPIGGHLLVVRQQPTVHAHADGNSGDALGGGEHQLQRVVAVRLALRSVEPTAAQVDLQLATVIDRDAGTDVTTLCKVLRERVAHGLPPAGNETLG